MDLSKHNNLKRLPKHLHKYIVDQNYSNYTAEDHAVWRYMMSISLDFLSKNAHISYVEGLKRTGINTELIPNIDEMNIILDKIGWGAVCVDGFIPPAAFMEFQAYRILVVAADIRNIHHLEYTPAPDIFHEAAGHAPIIGDSEYAEYLRLFGAIGSMAISSKQDNDLYEAIRKLSILKENNNSTQEEVLQAEKDILELQDNMGEMSEMAKIRNLHWWTVEYGLIGDINSPQIYGAGLLSSIGESVSCLQSKVKKIPYSIDAANKAFDITTKQPQLYVTPNFSHLTNVLNEFADTMALRKGGAESVHKAIDSNSYATCELSSGLQISGVFTNSILDENAKVSYLQTSGSTMLCEREKLIIGHGFESHADGFGSPVGKLMGLDKSLENMTLSELEGIGIITGKNCSLQFESGVIVSGKLHYVRKNKYGKILLMTFNDCSVTHNGQMLFEPQWGVYDMAVGAKVVSVFSGLADKDEGESNSYISPTTTIKANKVDEQLMHYYKSVDEIKQEGIIDVQLQKIYQKLQIDYPEDWLISIEIYSLALKASIVQLQEQLKQDLVKKSKDKSNLSKLILDGIRIAEQV